MTKTILSIKYTDKNLELPVCEEHEIKNDDDLKKIISGIFLDNKADEVQGTVYIQDKEICDERFVTSDKKYYGPNAPIEFVMLTTGGHEKRFCHTWLQQIGMHVPTRTIFYVDDREQVGFDDDVLDNPDNVFYKFKCNAPDRIIKLVMFVPMANQQCKSMSREELLEQVLKPAAVWFCNHLLENYRFLFGSDGYSNLRKAMSAKKN